MISTLRGRSAIFWRHPVYRRGKQVWFLLCVLLAGLTGPSAYAQAPQSSRFPVIPPQSNQAPVAPAEVAQTWTPIPATKLIIDTDPGVDDAVALVWLLTQSKVKQSSLEVLGIVATAGNTSVDNAARNVLQVLRWTGREGSVPVYKGADKPWEQSLSLTGALIHGPDGLWGAANSKLNLERVRDDPSSFYCTKAAAGLTILALAPLTNVAYAVRQCPERMAGVQIISLGGARGEGNQTPVTEFNYWQDPEAADFLVSNSLRYGYHVTLVPVHVFTQVAVDLNVLAAAGYPAELLGAVAQYLALTVGVDENGMPLPGPLQDTVAAIYAVTPDVVLPGDTPRAAVDALVKVVSGGGVPEFVRGQTVMAYNPDYNPLRAFIELGFWLTLAKTDREISQIIEPYLSDGKLQPEELSEIIFTFFGVLASAPPNATVVDQIDQAATLDALTKVSSAAAAEPSNVTGESVDEPAHRIYLPLLSDR